MFLVLWSGVSGQPDDEYRGDKDDIASPSIGTIEEMGERKDGNVTLGFKHMDPKRCNHYYKAKENSEE